MSHRIIIYICFGFALVLFYLVACDSSKGNDVEIDLTQYESEILAPLVKTYTGNISDGGGEVPCTYMGQLFEMIIEGSDDMECTSDETGKECNCSSATDGVLKAHGSIKIGADTVSVPIEMYIELSYLDFSNATPPLAISVSVVVPENDIYEDIISVSNGVEIQPGGNLTQLRWQKSLSDDTNNPSFESCIALLTTN